MREALEDLVRARSQNFYLAAPNRSIPVTPNLGDELEPSPGHGGRQDGGEDQ